MPLPHFLLMLLAVVCAAALTLFLSFAAGIPMIVLVLVALTGALLMHLGPHDGHDHDG